MYQRIFNLLGQAQTPYIALLVKMSFKYFPLCVSALSPLAIMRTTSLARVEQLDFLLVVARVCLPLSIEG